MRSTSSKIAWVMAVTWTAAVIVALVCLAAPMHPVLAGTTDEFWMCAVSAAPRWVEMGGTAEFVGNKAYYSPYTMDGSWIHAVGKDEAMREWPAVQRALETRAAAVGAADDIVVRGYRAWKALPTEEQDVSHLMAQVNASIETKLGRPGYLDPERQALHDGVTKAHRYWMNVVFELVFLGGLPWAVLYPLIRQRAVWRRCVHLASAPVVFLLPAWLGYCAVCANGVGPAGGIVYPWLIWAVHRMNFGWNWTQIFLKHTPKWLEVLNQSPAWTIEDMQLHYEVQLPGPWEAATAGLVVCGAYLAMRAWVRHLRTAHLRQPGFEVVMPDRG